MLWMLFNCLFILVLCSITLHIHLRSFHAGEPDLMDSYHKDFHFRQKHKNPWGRAHNCECTFTYFSVIKKALLNNLSGFLDFSFESNIFCIHIFCMAVLKCICETWVWLVHFYLCLQILTHLLWTWENWTFEERTSLFGIRHEMTFFWSLRSIIEYMFLLPCVVCLI